MIDAKRKALLFLTIAFILAIITAVLVLSGLREARQSLGETVKVAVAAEDIPAYTPVSSDAIKWVDMPKNDQSRSFIDQPGDLDNAVAVVNVAEGNVLTNNIIRSRMDIDANHRVVWLNATENVVIDQEVIEGDLVDIFVAIKKDGETLETKRVLENVKVVEREHLEEKDDVAVKVSLAAEDSARLIHYQNTAEQIRVLRVSQIPEQAAEEANDEPSNQQENKQPQEDKQKNEDKEKKEDQEKKNDAKSEDEE